MKKISVMVTTYNEKDNVVPLGEALIQLFQDKLSHYEYEILFMDNCSTDGTQQRIDELCCKYSQIRAIFNARNFGSLRSGCYGLLQVSGDCAIKLCADFQDPLEMIPQFVQEWENGYKIVCGIKTSSQENKIMRFFRTCYYKTIKKMSDVEQIEHFTGFGLYDRSFLEVLRGLDDPIPFLRGIVAEFGYQRKDIPYEQQKRRSGKSHYSLYNLYDTAMLSFTSYTKVGLRIATLLGFVMSAACILIAIVYLVLKLMYWDRFVMGMAPILIGVFLIGSIQIFFTGLIGEYIMSINTRVMHRPLVIEEKRINFAEKAKGDK
jgi:glycosyltransferase involved in cell wall biosynthesis